MVSAGSVGAAGTDAFAPAGADGPAPGSVAGAEFSVRGVPDPSPAGCCCPAGRQRPAAGRPGGAGARLRAEAVGPGGGAAAAAQRRPQRVDPLRDGVEQRQRAGGPVPVGAGDVVERGRRARAAGCRRTRRPRPGPPGSRRRTAAPVSSRTPCRVSAVHVVEHGAEAAAGRRSERCASAEPGAGEVEVELAAAQVGAGQRELGPLGRPLHAVERVAGDRVLAGRRHAGDRDRADRDADHDRAAGADARRRRCGGSPGPAYARAAGRRPVRGGQVGVGRRGGRRPMPSRSAVATSIARRPVRNSGSSSTSSSRQRGHLVADRDQLGELVVEAGPDVVTAAPVGLVESWAKRSARRRWKIVVFTAGTSLRWSRR